MIMSSKREDRKMWQTEWGYWYGNSPISWQFLVDTVGLCISTGGTGLVSITATFAVSAEVASKYRP